MFILEFHNSQDSDVVSQVEHEADSSVPDEKLLNGLSIARRFYVAQIYHLSTATDIQYCNYFLEIVSIESVCSLYLKCIFLKNTIDEIIFSQYSLS